MPSPLGARLAGGLGRLGLAGRAVRPLRRLPVSLAIRGPLVRRSLLAGSLPVTRVDRPSDALPHRRQANARSAALSSLFGEPPQDPCRGSAGVWSRSGFCLAPRGASSSLYSGSFLRGITFPAGRGLWLGSVGGSSRTARFRLGFGGWLSLGGRRLLALRPDPAFPRTGRASLSPRVWRLAGTVLLAGLFGALPLDSGPSWPAPGPVFGFGSAGTLTEVGCFPGPGGDWPGSPGAGFAPAESGLGSRWGPFSLSGSLDPAGEISF